VWDGRLPRALPSSGGQVCERMSMAEQTKREIVKEHRRHESDTGSAEVQVALLTARINHLAEHLRTHRKDHASRRGLLQMVGQRNSLLKYLSRTAPDRYQQLIQRLGLRK